MCYLLCRNRLLSMELATNSQGLRWGEREKKALASEKLMSLNYNNMSFEMLLRRIDSLFRELWMLIVYR